MLGIAWGIGTLLYLAIGAVRERDRTLDSALDLGSRAVLWPVTLFWKPSVRRGGD